MANQYLVGNAPQAASYAAPLVGFQLGQDIANAPKQFQEGQQYGVKRAQQTAFQNGLPTISADDPRVANGTAKAGDVDIPAIAQTITKLGGTESAQSLLPSLIGQQANQGLMQSMSPNGQPAAPGVTSSSATGPSGITGPPAKPQGQTATGQNTLIGIAGSIVGDQNAGYVAAAAAKAMGIDPNQPLTDTQVAQVTQAIPRIAQALSARGQQGAPAAMPGDGSQPPAPGGQNAAPAQPGSGTAPQPAPQPDNQGPVGGTSGGAPTTGLPPTYTQQNVDALRSRAQQILRSASQYGIGTEQGNRAQSAATMLNEQAQKMQDAITAATTPTDATKTALQSGYPNAAVGAIKTKENEQAVAQSQKTYDGLQGASSQYERGLKPLLDLSKAILNDPRVYTGTGANLSLDVNRIKSIYGDKNAALYQEGISKLTAAAALQQVNQQKDQMMEAGGSAGRIFASQIDLVMKSSPSLENTVAGNRLLVNIESRMGEASRTLTAMAQDYIAKNGHLDTQFDKMASAYAQAHPIFSKEELANPALLAAPEAPSNINTPQQAQAWKSGMGLSKGDPYRDVSGNIRYSK